MKTHTTQKILFFIMLCLSISVFAKDSFSGFYGGFELGHQNTETLWKAEGIPPPNNGGPSYDTSSPSNFKSNDAIYGGFIGHNLTKDKFIYGLELKANLGDSKKNLAGIPGCIINCGGYTSGAEIDKSSIKFDYGINLNGKFGIIQGDSLAAYAIGGISYQKIESSATCQQSGPDPICHPSDPVSDSTQLTPNRLFGGSIGAGVEKLFGPYGLKLEYIYTGFKKTSTLANFPGDVHYNYNIKPERQALTLGISYHF